MIILHFHTYLVRKDDDPIDGSLIEYVVLVEGVRQPEADYQEDYGGSGYALDVYELADGDDWPAQLPTDRALRSFF